MANAAKSANLGRIAGLELACFMCVAFSAMRVPTMGLKGLDGSCGWCSSGIDSVDDFM